MGRLWNLFYAFCCGVFVTLFVDFIGRYFCAEEDRCVVCVDVGSALVGIAATVYFVRHPEA